MRNYDELRNALEKFKNAYWDLIVAFDKDDDVNEFLTEDSIYQTMNECFAVKSFDELPIPDWCNLIINYLNIEQRVLQKTIKGEQKYAK